MDIEEKRTHTAKQTVLKNQDRALLKYLSDNKDYRFNLKAYSRLSKIPRATIYGKLDRLIKLRLVTSEHTGNFKITGMGITYIETHNGGVQSVRRECRKEDIKEGNLSTHYLKYKLPISDRERFTEQRLSEIGAFDSRKITWNKDYIYYAYFEDATLIIKPKVINIRIHDVITDDLEESHFNTLKKAIEYTKKIARIGIKTSSMELESVHYARVESILSEFLSSIDNRYYLDLGDGKKFWIDNSGGKNEDETNEVEVRRRIDSFMTTISNNDVDLQDISKMKEVMSLVVQSFAINTARENELKNGDRLLPEEQPNYFG